MEKKLYDNLPPGATHVSKSGTFLKKYPRGWLYWVPYHQGWLHLEHVVVIDCEVGEV